MKAFLLDITLAQAIVYFIINLMILFAAIYFKPAWYTTVFSILLAALFFVVVYKMGWYDSMEFFEISYAISPNTHYFKGVFWIILLLHWLIFDRMAKKRVVKEEEN